MKNINKQKNLIKVFGSNSVTNCYHERRSLHDHIQDIQIVYLSLVSEKKRFISYYGKDYYGSISRTVSHGGFKIEIAA